MDYNQYISRTLIEARLKQRLANLIGRGFDDLSSLSVKDLLREVELQKQDYVVTDCGKYLKHEVEDAYLFINHCFPYY